MQANGNGTSGELSDLRNYLISRLLWNPELDDQKLIKEFVELHHGSAAPPILEYIEMLHDNAEKSAVHPNCFPKPEEVGLRPEIARKALDYFNRALELADNDAVRARVEKASICAYRTMIDAGGLLTKAELKPIVDSYVELCQRYEMTFAAEHKEAATFFEELRSRVKDAS